MSLKFLNGPDATPEPFPAFVAPCPQALRRVVLDTVYGAGS